MSFNTAFIHVESNSDGAKFISVIELPRIPIEILSVSNVEEIKKFLTNANTSGALFLSHVIDVWRDLDQSFINWVIEVRKDARRSFEGLDEEGGDVSLNQFKSNYKSVMEFVRQISKMKMKEFENNFGKENYGIVVKWLQLQVALPADVGILKEHYNCVKNICTIQYKTKEKFIAPENLVDAELFMKENAFKKWDVVIDNRVDKASLDGATNSKVVDSKKVAHDEPKLKQGEVDASSTSPTENQSVRPVDAIQALVTFARADPDSGVKQLLAFLEEHIRDPKVAFMAETIKRQFLTQEFWTSRGFNADSFDQYPALKEISVKVAQPSLVNPKDSTETVCCQVQIGTVEGGAEINYSQANDELHKSMLDMVEANADKVHAGPNIEHMSCISLGYAREGSLGVNALMKYLRPVFQGEQSEENIWTPRNGDKKWIMPSEKSSYNGRLLSGWVVVLNRLPYNQIMSLMCLCPAFVVKHCIIEANSGIYVINSVNEYVNTMLTFHFQERNAWLKKTTMSEENKMLIAQANAFRRQLGGAGIELHTKSDHVMANWEFLTKRVDGVPTMSGSGSGKQKIAVLADKECVEATGLSLKFLAVGSTKQLNLVTIDTPIVDSKSILSDPACQNKQFTLPPKLVWHHNDVSDKVLDDLAAKAIETMKGITRVKQTGRQSTIFLKAGI